MTHVISVSGNDHAVHVLGSILPVAHKHAFPAMREAFLSPEWSGAASFQETFEIVHPEGGIEPERWAYRSSFVEHGNLLGGGDKFVSARPLRWNLSCEWEGTLRDSAYARLAVGARFNAFTYDRLLKRQELEDVFGDLEATDPRSGILYIRKRQMFANPLCHRFSEIIMADQAEIYTGTFTAVLH